MSVPIKKRSFSLNECQSFLLDPSEKPALQQPGTSIQGCSGSNNGPNIDNGIEPAMKIDSNVGFTNISTSNIRGEVQAAIMGDSNMSEQSLVSAVGERKSNIMSCSTKSLFSRMDIQSSREMMQRNAVAVNTSKVVVKQEKHDETAELNYSMRRGSISGSVVGDAGNSGKVANFDLNAPAQSWIHPDNISSANEANSYPSVAVASQTVDGTSNPGFHIGASTFIPIMSQQIEPHVHMHMHDVFSGGSNTSMKRAANANFSRKSLLYPEVNNAGVIDFCLTNRASLPSGDITLDLELTLPMMRKIDMSWKDDTAVQELSLSLYGAHVDHVAPRSHTGGVPIQSAVLMPVKREPDHAIFSVAAPVSIGRTEQLDLPVNLPSETVHSMRETSPLGITSAGLGIVAGCSEFQSPEQSSNLQTAPGRQITSSLDVDTLKNEVGKVVSCVSPNIEVSEMVARPIASAETRAACIAYLDLHCENSVDGEILGVSDNPKIAGSVDHKSMSVVASQPMGSFISAKCKDSVETEVTKVNAAIDVSSQVANYGPSAICSLKKSVVTSADDNCEVAENSIPGPETESNGYNERKHECARMLAVNGSSPIKQNALVLVNRESEPLFDSVALHPSDLDERVDMSHGITDMDCSEDYHIVFSSQAAINGPDGNSLGKLNDAMQGKYFHNTQPESGSASVSERCNGLSEGSEAGDAANEGSNMKKNKQKSTDEEVSDILNASTEQNNIKLNDEEVSNVALDTITDQMETAGNITCRKRVGADSTDDKNVSGHRSTPEVSLPAKVPRGLHEKLADGRRSSKPRVPQLGKMRRGDGIDTGKRPAKQSDVSAYADMPKSTMDKPGYGDKSNSFKMISARNDLDIRAESSEQRNGSPGVEYLKGKGRWEGRSLSPGISRREWWNDGFMHPRGGRGGRYYGRGGYMSSGKLNRFDGGIHGYRGRGRSVYRPTRRFQTSRSGHPYEYDFMDGATLATIENKRPARSPMRYARLNGGLLNDIHRQRHYSSAQLQSHRAGIAVIGRDESLSPEPIARVPQLLHHRHPRDKQIHAFGNGNEEIVHIPENIMTQRRELPPYGRYLGGESNLHVFAGRSQIRGGDIMRTIRPGDAPLNLRDDVEDMRVVELPSQGEHSEEDARMVPYRPSVRKFPADEGHGPFHPEDKRQKALRFSPEGRSFRETSDRSLNHFRRGGGYEAAGYRFHGQRGRGEGNPNVWIRESGRQHD